MVFIRETSKRHFVGVLCVVSGDSTDLLPVKLLVPELETGVLISQSICFVLVESPFKNVNKILITSLLTPSTDNPSVDLLAHITSTSLRMYCWVTI